MTIPAPPPEPHRHHTFPMDAHCPICGWLLSPDGSHLTPARRPGGGQMREKFPGAGARR